MIPNERERVLDLVNDAGGQRADRRHPFRQQQSLLKLALGGHVDDRRDGTLEAPRRIGDEAPVHANVSWFTANTS